MLTIDGAPLRGGSGEQLLATVLAHDALQRRTREFLGSSCTLIAKGDRSLCVLQGEQALVNCCPNSKQNNKLTLNPDDGASSQGKAAVDHASVGGVGANDAGASTLYIGSEDATTCVIAVLRCPITKLTFAAHFDGGTLSDEDSVASAVSAMQCSTPELYLVGGYREDKGEGFKASCALLELFHQTVTQEVSLKLACLYSANTDSSGGPCARQLAVDCRTGEFRGTIRCFLVWCVLTFDGQCAVAMYGSGTP